MPHLPVLIASLLTLCAPQIQLQRGKTSILLDSFLGGLQIKKTKDRLAREKRFLFTCVWESSEKNVISGGS